MAKQLLGKEVTTALNERIKVKVAQLEDTAGLHGDPGSLWNRLHRQEGSCHRPQPRSRKAGSNDADQEECNCYRMPYKDR